MLITGDMLEVRWQPAERKSAYPARPDPGELYVPQLKLSGRSAGQSLSNGRNGMLKLRTAGGKRMQANGTHWPAAAEGRPFQSKPSLLDFSKAAPDLREGASAKPRSLQESFMCASGAFVQECCMPPPGFRR